MRKKIKTLKLKRDYLDNCTLGEVFYQGERLFCSVEKPWLSNQPFFSCIPPGTYKIHRHNSKKHPNSFYLMNKNLGVEYSKNKRNIRYGILIHIANFPHEVNGCLGLGMGFMEGKYGVTQSRIAMKKLNDLIRKSEQWQLEIEI